MAEDVQIFADERWTLVPACSSHDEGWDQVPCFRFEYPDGRVCYAQTLSEEQHDQFQTQVAERLERDRRILERHAA